MHAQLPPKNTTARRKEENSLVLALTVSEVCVCVCSEAPMHSGTMIS
jgi:hypothetical protein